MNKLSLSCLKSLVKSRPKGDWNFMTQLILTWPEARTYYWKKQGFRTLLSSWPFTVNNISFLHTPQGLIEHGFQLSPQFPLVLLTLMDRGQHLFQISGTCSPFSIPGDLELFASQGKSIWIYFQSEAYPGDLVPYSIRLDQTEPDFGSRVLWAARMFPDFIRTILRAIRMARNLTPARFLILEEMVQILANQGFVGSCSEQTNHE